MSSRCSFVRNPGKLTPVFRMLKRRCAVIVPPENSEVDFQQIAQRLHSSGIEIIVYSGEGEIPIPDKNGFIVVANSVSEKHGARLKTMGAAARSQNVPYRVGAPGAIEEMIRREFSV